MSVMRATPRVRRGHCAVVKLLGTPQLTRCIVRAAPAAARGAGARVCRAEWVPDDDGLPTAARASVLRPQEPPLVRGRSCGRGASAAAARRVASNRAGRHSLPRPIPCAWADRHHRAAPAMLRACPQQWFRERPFPVPPEEFPHWPAKSEGKARTKSPTAPRGGDDDAAAFNLGNYEMVTEASGATYAGAKSFALRF